jgi:WW domain
MSNYDASASLIAPRTAVVSAANEECPTPMLSEGDWSAFISRDSGQVYYFHRVTGESRWEPPTETFVTTISLAQIAPAAVPKGMSVRTLRANWQRQPQCMASQGDWSQYKSHDEKIFYYHRVTGKSQWDPPRAFRLTLKRVRPTVKQTTFPKPSVTEKSNLPLLIQGEWSAYWDPTYNRAYYFHRITGESVWEPPAGFPEIQSKKAVAPKKQVHDVTTAGSWYLEQMTKAAWTSFQDMTAQWRNPSVDPSISTKRRQIGGATRRSLLSVRTAKPASSSTPSLTFTNLFSIFDTLRPMPQATQVIKKSIIQRKHPQFPFADLFRNDRPTLPSTGTSRTPKVQQGFSFPQISVANLFATNSQEPYRRNGTYQRPVRTAMIGYPVPFVFPFGGISTGRKPIVQKRGPGPTRHLVVH